MNINNLLRAFTRKLLLEGLMKSSLFAGTVGCSFAFLLSLIYHIMVKETDWPLLLTLFVSVFFLSFILLFGLFLYPTKKRVAARMDRELGLQDRVGALLEFQNCQSEMAKLQRTDAISHIESTSPKQMKFRPMARDMIICCIVFCMTAVMLSLPHDIFVFAEPEINMDNKQEQIIRDFIEQLREEINNSQLDEELKDSIHEIVDKLEEDLNKTDNELEQAGKIEEAKKEISDLLDKQLTKNSIGKELQKYALTKALGQAISAGETKEVTNSLHELENELRNDNSLVQRLYNIIDRVLTDSEVDPADDLYKALEQFSTDLKQLSPKNESFEKDLSTAFDKAENAIHKALEKQAIIESEKEKLEDIMSDAKDELLDNKNDKEKGEGEKGEGEEGEGEEGEGEGEGEGEEGKGEGKGEEGENGSKPGGNKPGGDMPGNNTEDSMGGGDGSNEEPEDTMTEIFYDPISGEVTYGKVFAIYYAEYLAALKAGKVPDQLQQIMDAYFSSLNGTKE